MVAITGNVPNALIGKDAFQEIDITGITLPMTKHNYLVRERRRHPARRRRGVLPRQPRPARAGPRRHHEGRPPAGDDRRAPLPRRRHRRAAGLPPDARGPPQAAQARRPEIAERQAAADPRRARRPHRGRDGRAQGVRGEDPDPRRVDAAGHRCAGRGAPARATATWACTAGSTSTARSSPPTCSSRSGCGSTTGSPASVRTYAPYARIIHADIDPAEIGKNVAVEVPIVGDAKHVLRRPDPPRPRGRPGHPRGLRRPARRLAGATPRAARGTARAPGRDGLLSADYVVERIGELTDHTATYVADVGQNQMWLARYAGFRRPEQPRQLRRPRDDGLRGPGGHGRGARPPRRRDLGDRRRRRLPDDEPGADDPRRGPHPGEDRAARQPQARDDPPVAGDHLRGQLPLRRTCPARTSSSSRRPTGSPPSARRRPRRWTPSIKAAQAVDGPALIWFEIAEEQNVFPMMPAGKGLSDLIETWGAPEE